MEHIHNDSEQMAEFGAEPRRAQAPDQILPIRIKDKAQTLIFVLAEWHGGRFPDGHGVAYGVDAQLRPIGKAVQRLFGGGLARIAPRIFPLLEKLALLVPAATQNSEFACVCHPSACFCDSSGINGV
jgi:hypothetical protein